MKYRINYSKVVEQANFIQDNADEFNTQIRFLNQLEKDCCSCWKGEASDAYIIKLRQLISEMIRTKEQMSILSSSIKYYADRIQREDVEAAQKAAALSSGY